MSRRARATSAVILAFVACLAPARAARADRGDPAAAEALFRAGRAAAESGDYAKACEKFHESERLDPAPGTVFNIADCEEKLGHLATAWTLFREVSQRFPANDERSAIATARAKALEGRLPKLSIRLAAGSPPGARVFRDGVELQAGSLDTALPVDPGTHVLAVEAPGRRRIERKIDLRESESKNEILNVGEPSSDDTASPAAGGGSGLRTLGFVAGGVGIVSLGVGTVTGFMVLDRKSTVDENCDEAKLCNQAGVDAADSGSTLAPISGATLIGGVILLSAGIVLVVTGGSSASASKSAFVAAPSGAGFTHRF